MSTEQKNKKWVIKAIIFVLIPVIVMASVMFVTDSLLVFRKESDVFTCWNYSQPYSGPGVARQYDYDAVITGSSMVGQADTDELSELYGNEFIKLTYNSANAHNWKTILDVVFESHPNTEKVILSLDPLALVEPSDETANPLPEYLYDISWETYPSYLLNMDIFYHITLKNITGTLKGEHQLAMQAKPEECSYGKEVVYNNYTPSFIANYSKSDTSQYAKNVQDNIKDNLIPLFEEHPNTTFKLFVPCYSILYWDKREGVGETDSYLDALIETEKALLQYDNVEIYSYMSDLDIIENLDNYKDVMHFSPEIESLFLNEMYNGIGRVTEENYVEQIESFREYIHNFDYETFWNQLEEEVGK